MSTRIKRSQDLFRYIYQGYKIARLLRLSWFDTKTISIETSIQNSTTAITLAPIIMATTAGLPAIALPAAVYGVLMYIVAIPVIALIRNKE